MYETTPGRSVVAAVAPLVTLGRVGNQALAPLGAEVDAKLRRVMAVLESSGSDVMSDYLWPLLFLAVWVVLQTWLLPRLGVPT